VAIGVNNDHAWFTSTKMPGDCWPLPRRIRESGSRLLAVNRTCITIMTLAALASSAHAEGWLVPIQGDVEVEFASGSQVFTSATYLDLSAVAPIVEVGHGWLAFGGIGFADQIVTYWKRSDRIAPDAITAIHAPGLEGRIGLIRGRAFGAPRVVAKVTPMWARGVSEMGLPSDRGAGLRTSVGVSWPGWLMGRIEPDAPGTKSYDQTSTFAMMFAIFVPTQIEYVFTHVPGDDRHGVAFGWGF
ncbi:MAG: hypothetical protein ABI867_41945, partial [Kofleriaceae bacterium]